jgi:ATP sulfurylase
VYINEFKLFDDTLFSVTQPIVFTTSNKLRNKHIKLGSKVDLTVATEFNIGNKDIDSSIKNIFKDSVIVNPSVQIVKLNDDYTLPSRVTVSAFADTSAYMDVTSDNTLIFNWDTNALYTLPSVLNGTFGPLTGAYQVQVKYSVLNQTILSDYLNLIVN